MNFPWRTSNNNGKHWNIGYKHKILNNTAINCQKEALLSHDIQ